MERMEKQTAIDWLLENLISEPYSEADFKHNSDCWDKAKEMEKKQREKDFVNGYKARAKGSNLIFDETSEMYAIKLFNETFKSE